MAYPFSRYVINISGCYNRINMNARLGFKCICIFKDGIVSRNINHLKTENITNGQDVITMAKVKEHFISDMDVDRGYSPLKKSRFHLMHALPRSQDELPPRKMKDSYTTAVIPLTKDVSLQESYISTRGRLRLDKLLEDMDMFAVCVAHKHILNPNRKSGDKSPHILVTVHVDRISFAPLKRQYISDIFLSGHVSWVGETSLAVTEWVEHIVDGQPETVTEAVFFIAARNAVLNGPTYVNKLIADDDEEIEVLKNGDDKKSRRIEVEKLSLFKVVPNNEELKVIHNLFLSTLDTARSKFPERVLPSNSVWMSDAQYYNIFNGYPKERNAFNTLFGGFLMQQALALSWHAGRLYCKAHPLLLHVTNIYFKKPILVGAIIKMHAHVVYTQDNYLQIAVFTDAYNSLTEESIQSNSFHFTYVLNDNVKAVVPHSYSDAMLYIDGRRNFQKVMGPLPKPLYV